MSHTILRESVLRQFERIDLLTDDLDGEQLAFLTTASADEWEIVLMTVRKRFAAVNYAMTELMQLQHNTYNRLFGICDVTTREHRDVAAAVQERLIASGYIAPITEGGG